jgi:hypothetical protein
VGVVREVLEEMFISETKIMSRIFGPSEKRWIIFRLFNDADLNLEIVQFQKKWKYYNL